MYNADRQPTVSSTAERRSTRSTSNPNPVHEIVQAISSRFTGSLKRGRFFAEFNGVSLRNFIEKR
jgi:hypothetical protein